MPGFDLADPERRLAIGYASASARDGLGLLFALDERLGRIVARTREPAIGLMRLVWWRDALAAVDRAPPPAEPLLTAIARQGLPGAALAGMVDGWEALIDDPGLAPETIAIYGRERGARLFELAGRVIGRDDARLADAGMGWALADLARHGSGGSIADRILEQARAPLDRALARRWPRVLRPLGMLAMLARQDVRRGAGRLRPAASRARLLRMMGYQLGGR